MIQTILTFIPVTEVLPDDMSRVLFLIDTTSERLGLCRGYYDGKRKVFVDTDRFVLAMELGEVIYWATMPVFDKGVMKDETISL